jgi:hypothetical protein
VGFGMDCLQVGNPDLQKRIGLIRNDRCGLIMQKNRPSKNKDDISSMTLITM